MYGTREWATKKIVFLSLRFGTAARWRGGRGYGKGRIGGGGRAGGRRHTCNSLAYLTNTLIVLHVSSRAGGMFAVNCAAHTKQKTRRQWGTIPLLVTECVQTQQHTAKRRQEDDEYRFGGFQQTVFLLP